MARNSESPQGTAEFSEEHCPQAGGIPHELGASSLRAFPSVNKFCSFHFVCTVQDVSINSLRMPLKTLFLNPPSFEGFDGGASSRWPATREIESYWYPVWLAYPAGMLPGSRLLDAAPHKITPEQTVAISRDYDFVVIFTSLVGFQNDLRLIGMMKEAKPDLKVAFVGPPVQVKPTESLMASENIDFVVRGEFDYAVVEFAQGKP